MSSAPGQPALLDVGKASVHPWRTFKRFLGEMLRASGARATEWELSCGHRVVINRANEGKFVRRRCEQCPLERPKS